MQNIDRLVLRVCITSAKEEYPHILVWRMSLGPEQTLLTLGSDLDKGTDQGFIFLHFEIIFQHYC